MKKLFDGILRFAGATLLAGLIIMVSAAVMSPAGPGSWKNSASDLYGSGSIQSVIDGLLAGTQTGSAVTATNLTSIDDVTVGDDLAVGDDAAVVGKLSVGETANIVGKSTFSNDMVVVGSLTSSVALASADVTATDDLVVGDDAAVSGLLTVDEAVSCNSLSASGGVTALSYTFGTTAGKTFAITNISTLGTNVFQFGVGGMTGAIVNGVQK